MSKNLILDAISEGHPKTLMRSVYISLLIALFWANPAWSASFDCEKAGTTQEIMICSDKTLSNLDEQLEQVYNSVALQTAQPGLVKKQQREWIKKVRNNCTSKPCLKEVYQKRIKELNAQATENGYTRSTCPITEKSLIAGWGNISGDGFFEEMAFEYEDGRRVFNSWLHHRPEIMNGTWKLENCTIFINHPTTKELSFVLKVVKARKDRIYLRDVRDKDYAVYRRIKD